MGVAPDTGIGRQAIFVGGNKLSDNTLFKFRLEGEGMVGNPQLFCHSLGIQYILVSTATEIMEAHGTACAVKFLLQHHPGSNRTVHTAAHTNEGFLFLHRTPPEMFSTSIATAGWKVNGQL